MCYPITYQRLEQQASDRSFEKGEQYFLNNAVEWLIVIDTTIHGYVRGTNLYHAKITDTGIGVCSCPYDFGGWCKHVVALGLRYLESLEQNQLLPTLHFKDILSTLSPQQLKQTLSDIVHTNPLLLHNILPQGHEFHTYLPDGTEDKEDW